jgi:hypothetical protein
VSVGLVVSSIYLHRGLAELVGPVYARHSAVFLALIAIGAIQFGHNLLGYICSAAGRFYLPLWINVAVASVGAGGAIALGELFGVRGVLIGLGVANLTGLCIAVVFTRGLVNTAAIRGVLLGAALAVSGAASAYGLSQVSALPRSLGAAAIALLLLTGVCVALQVNVMRLRFSPRLVERLR